MLNILVLGDLHVTVKNLKETDIYLDALSTYLKNNKNSIDYVCIAGDILDSHERLHSSCLNKAIEYIRLVSQLYETFILVGNHDMVNQSAFLDSEHWMNCVKDYKNVTVVDNILITTLKGQKIVFTPYVPDGKFIQALDTKKGEWENAKCIFGHVTIKGCSMGSMIAKDADEWPENHPMLISGHIHKSQWLTSNMYYTGSIMQVATDEPPEKHIVSVCINDTITIREVDLDLPKKIIMNIDIEEIDDMKIPDNESHTKYTLYISGSYEQFKTFKKSSNYKDLLKLSNVNKICFKSKYNNTLKKMEIEELKQHKQKHFNDILYETVKMDNDELLMYLYKHIMNGEEDKTDELLKLH